MEESRRLREARNSASGSVSGSDHSAAGQVVWKQPSPRDVALVEEWSSPTAHMKQRQASAVCIEACDDDHDDEEMVVGAGECFPARLSPSALRAASVASGRQSSPPNGYSTNKRPSMHFRPVDVRDVLDALQEEDTAAIAVAGAGQSGSSCPYVVPGLYAEVCRQYEQEEEEEDGDDVNVDDEYLSDAKAGDSRALDTERALSFHERETAAEELAVPITLATVCARAEAEEVEEEAVRSAFRHTSHTLGPPETAVSCDDGASDGEVRREPAGDAAEDDNDDDDALSAWGAHQEAVETLVLKELVARDALETMAQAEAEAAVLIALRRCVQWGDGSTASRPRTEVAQNDDHDADTLLANEQVGGDAIVLEDVVVAETETLLANDQGTALAGTPHAPSSSRPSRSSPRAMSGTDIVTAAADSVVAAAAAAPMEEAAVMSAAGSPVCAAASESLDGARGVTHTRKAESVPADRTHHTPTKRCSSALADTTAAPLLLPALSRSPEARFQPYNALLESVKRTQKVSALPSLTRPSAVQPGPRTAATSATLPHIGQRSRLHLIDQRRFYERGGQYDYRSLYKQQEKRETLRQLVAPLPNTIDD